MAIASQLRIHLFSWWSSLPTISAYRKILSGLSSSATKMSSQYICPLKSIHVYTFQAHSRNQSLHSKPGTPLWILNYAPSNYLQWTSPSSCHTIVSIPQMQIHSLLLSGSMLRGFDILMQCLLWSLSTLPLLPIRALVPKFLYVVLWI